MTDNKTPADGAINLDSEELTDEPTTQLQEKKWWPLRRLSEIAGLIILVLAIFITATVLLRFFGVGVVGAVELSSLSMVILTALVAPAVAATDGNFRVEIIDFFAGRRVIRGFNIFALIIQLVVVVFITFATLDLFITDIQTGTTMAGELYLPRWLMSSLVFLGFLGVTYATIVNLTRALRSSTLTTGSEG